MWEGSLSPIPLTTANRNRPSEKPHKKFDDFRQLLTALPSPAMLRMFPKLLLNFLLRLWTLPNTLFGCCFGLIGLATGGRVQLRRGVLEFYGGGVTWMLDRVPGMSGILAMTLGHTILGQSPAALDLARDHEHVHVRQFERWGPAMLPAYLGCTVWIWMRGNGRPYRDNPFEVEAYAADDLRSE